MHRGGDEREIYKLLSGENIYMVFTEGISPSYIPNFLVITNGEYTSNYPFQAYAVTFRNHKPSVEFTGKGFGHGVGMSQWGAKEMAEEGYSFKQILSHFYKGTELNKLY